MTHQSVTTSGSFLSARLHQPWILVLSLFICSTARLHAYARDSDGGFMDASEFTSLVPGDGDFDQTSHHPYPLPRHVKNLISPAGSPALVPAPTSKNTLVEKQSLKRLESRSGGKNFAENHVLPQTAAAGASCAAGATRRGGMRLLFDRDAEEASTKGKTDCGEAVTEDALKKALQKGVLTPDPCELEKIRAYANQNNKILAVMRYASWCPHCQHAQPLVQEGVRLLSEAGTHSIVSVAIDCASPDNCFENECQDVEAFPTYSLVMPKQGAKNVTELCGGDATTELSSEDDWLASGRPKIDVGNGKCMAPVPHVEWHKGKLGFFGQSSYTTRAGWFHDAPMYKNYLTFYANEALGASQPADLVSLVRTTDAAKLSEPVVPDAVWSTYVTKMPPFKSGWPKETIADEVSKRLERAQGAVLSLLKFLYNGMTNGEHNGTAKKEALLTILTVAGEMSAKMAAAVVAATGFAASSASSSSSFVNVVNEAETPGSLLQLHGSGQLYQQRTRGSATGGAPNPATPSSSSVLQQRARSTPDHIGQGIAAIKTAVNAVACTDSSEETSCSSRLKTAMSDGLRTAVDPNQHIPAHITTAALWRSFHVVAANMDPAPAFRLMNETMFFWMTCDTCRGHYLTHGAQYLSKLAQDPATLALAENKRRRSESGPSTSRRGTRSPESVSAAARGAKDASPCGSLGCVSPSSFLSTTGTTSRKRDSSSQLWDFQLGLWAFHNLVSVRVEAEERAGNCSSSSAQTSTQVRLLDRRWPPCDVCEHCWKGAGDHPANSDAAMQASALVCKEQQELETPFVAADELSCSSGDFDSGGGSGGGAAGGGSSLISARVTSAEEMFAKGEELGDAFHLETVKELLDEVHKLPPAGAGASDR